MLFFHANDTCAVRHGVTDGGAVSREDDVEPRWRSGVFHVHQ